MQIKHYSSLIQIEYLHPLINWGMLDLRGLMKESNFPASYISFSRIISNLEKNNFVESMRDPFTKTKYVYLSREGARYLMGEDKKMRFSPKHFVHDMGVIKILKDLNKHGLVSNITVPKTEKDQNYIEKLYRFCPDAVVVMKGDGRPKTVAIELELTRKSKTKYLDKASNYIISRHVDKVIYFFHNSGVLKSYRKHIVGKYGAKAMEKYIFILNKKLLTKDFKLEESKVYSFGNEYEFKEYFNLT